MYALLYCYLTQEQDADDGEIFLCMYALLYCYLTQEQDADDGEIFLCMYALLYCYLTQEQDADDGETLFVHCYIVALPRSRTLMTGRYFYVFIHCYIVALPRSRTLMTGRYFYVFIHCYIVTLPRSRTLMTGRRCLFIVILLRYPGAGRWWRGDIFMYLCIVIYCYLTQEQDADDGEIFLCIYTLLYCYVTQEQDADDGETLFVHCYIVTLPRSRTLMTGRYFYVFIHCYIVALPRSRTLMTGRYFYVFIHCYIVALPRSRTLMTGRRCLFIVILLRYPGAGRWWRGDISMYLCIVIYCYLTQEQDADDGETLFVHCYIVTLPRSRTLMTGRRCLFIVILLRYPGAGRWWRGDAVCSRLQQYPRAALWCGRHDGTLSAQGTPGGVPLVPRGGGYWGDAPDQYTAGRLQGEGGDTGRHLWQARNSGQFKQPRSKTVSIETQWKYKNI